jgi:hypothetical protein
MSQARRFRAPYACAALLFAAAFAPGARAGSTPPDWAAAADVDTIQIRTTDEEGALRERTVWLVVIDGQAYVRAGGTSRWDSNVDAAPDVEVQIGGIWFALRATRVPEGPTTEAVVAAMREKYGWSDALIGLVRGIGASPRILRLDPRPGLPMGG